MGVILDPTGTSEEKQKSMAPRRLQSLAGVTVGLMDSGKPRSDLVLAHIGELLQERYGVKEVVMARKPSWSRPVPPEMVDELAKKVGVIITGIGD